ncbi:Glycolipid transfer protein 1 [Glycine max]|nr:Glycolipid transfer protein 1 [Glycine max]
MEGTVFTPALQEIEHVKSDQGEILSKPFLDACKHILPVIDKFGAAMALVKSDIGGNISRLETMYSSNPTRFNYLYSLVQVEVETKTAKSSSSCTNGLLWLTRAMDFLVALFRNLIEHEDWPMSQACTDSYNKTLKKWHGWLASSSFTVVMKLAPDRKKFMDVIGGTGNISADIEKFCTTFSPLLEENHKFLVRTNISWIVFMLKNELLTFKTFISEFIKLALFEQARFGLDDMKAS